MNEIKPEIKLMYITGLREVVLSEVGENKSFHVLDEGVDSIYLDYIPDLDLIKKLRSIDKACVVFRDTKYNPLYISNHKSILNSLVNIVLTNKNGKFKSFKIICAGDDSPEVRAVAEYIQNQYQITEKEEADLKIHIVKSDKVWEVGVQITPRPLSVREYKVRNMSGAMDSTIAYALNSFCQLDKAKSYLNVFSGSGTLLIEAGQCYPNLEKLVGFDNDKKNLSIAIGNIKAGGLIKKIQIKEGDIFDKPDFGRFDVVTANLPFGMAISKNDDLEELYKSFIDYCQTAINKNGRLAVYTSESKILEKVIKPSNFKVVNKLELKFMTSVGAYLRPKIFVCQLK